MDSGSSFPKEVDAKPKRSGNTRLMVGLIQLNGLPV